MKLLFFIQILILQQEKLIQFERTMQNNHHNQLNLQNQPIFQTIDNSYVQILVNFLEIISYQHFTYYQSNSTATLPHSEHDNNPISQVSNLLLLTVEGYIAVPVSDMHWLYLKQTLRSNQIQYSQNAKETVANPMNYLIGKENCVLGAIYEKQKRKAFLESRGRKIQGFQYNLCTIQLQKSIVNQQVITVGLELMLFESLQKTKTEQKNQEQSCQRQNYQRKRHFGVMINKNIPEKTFNQFISKIFYLNLTEIKQKQTNPHMQTVKNDQKMYIPMMVEIQNMIYLVGFKKQKKIFFAEGLASVFNKRVQKVQGKINLGSENIGYVGIKYIQMYKWHNLQSLNLWWNMLGELGAKVISQGYFPHLNVLDLRKNFIGNSGLEQFRINGLQQKNINDKEGCYISKFPNLQQLFLTDNNLNSAHQITSLIFPRLNQLQLQNNNLEINDPCNIQISCINTLKILSLRNNKITGQGLNNLNLPNLQKLYLSNNMLITCQPLSRAYLPKLKIIELSKNKLNQVKSLRKSIFFLDEQIQELDLSDNQIQQIIGFEEVNFGALIDIKFGNNRNKRNDVIKDTDKINYFSWIFKCQLRSSIYSTITTPKQRKLKLLMQGNSFKLQKIKIYSYLLKMISYNIISS